MEKYSSAVREMYSQFKKGEPHPWEKHIGQSAMCYGRKVEVVGYSDDGWTDKPLLIVDASNIKAWSWDYLDADDVVFKKCESYCYASINDLID